MSTPFTSAQYTDLLLSNAELNHVSLNEDFCKKTFRYIQLLIEWNSKFNITSHQSMSDFICKDVLDQVIAFQKLAPYLSNATHIIDVGAGAGFSGIILALYYTPIGISFLEKNRKKINFIRHCCLDLGIKAKFHHCSLDSSLNTSLPLFDVILSRATWDIPLFINYVQNYVRNNGYAIYFGGPQQFFTQNQVIQNIEFKDELHYTILPYNYNRKLFVFKKNKSST